MNPLSLIIFTLLVQTLLSDHVTGTAVRTINGFVKLEGADCKPDCKRAARTVGNSRALQWNDVMRRRWGRDKTCSYDGREPRQRYGYECVHFQGTTIPCRYNETTDEFMCTVDRRKTCGIFMLHFAFNVIQSAIVHLRIGGELMPPKRDQYPVGPVVKQYFDSGNVLHEVQSFELSCSNNRMCLQNEITLLAYQYGCETTICRRSALPTECSETKKT